jgi:hypothetical protein
MNLTCSLDIEVFGAEAFLPDCGEVLDIRKAPEVDTGLPDLGIAEFKAKVVKRKRLNGSPIKLHPVPDVKMDIPIVINPHGYTPVWIV